MIRSKQILFAATVLALAGCENDYKPPVITAPPTRNRKSQPVDLAQAQEGRRLFAHRCIECHTLPPIWHYRTEDWPKIVDSMAHRSALKPAERDAIIAYILAARAQKKP